MHHCTFPSNPFMDRCFLRLYSLIGIHNTNKQPTAFCARGQIISFSPHAPVRRQKMVQTFRFYFRPGLFTKQLFCPNDQTKTPSWLELLTIETCQMYFAVEFKQLPQKMRHISDFQLFCLPLEVCSNLSAPRERDKIKNILMQFLSSGDTRKNKTIPPVIVD